MKVVMELIAESWGKSRHLRYTSRGERPCLFNY